MGSGLDHAAAPSDDLQITWPMQPDRLHEALNGDTLLDFEIGIVHAATETQAIGRQHRGKG